MVKLNAPKKSKRSVLPVIALLLAAVVAVFFASRNSQSAPAQTEYVIGQQAREDVVAPRNISVVDPVETEARRQIEMEKVPAMFRFKQSAANEAVETFNADFKTARKEFLDAVQKDFKKRTLSTNQPAGPRFRAIYTTFKANHHTFPATVGQALKWAHGNAQEELQKQFRERLRISASKFIRADEMPSAARGPFRVLNESATGSTDALMDQSQPVLRAELVALTKARNDLAARFRPDERVVSDVLTNFIQINCVFDEQLTAQLRAERANTIWSLVSFEPGQVIVRRGQIIDAKTKAALDQLNGVVPGANQSSHKQLWLWAVAISCVALALLIGLRSLVSRRETASVPMDNVLVLPSEENNSQDLQTKLIPHLARGLMNKLVRGLISQRSDLIQTQNAGSEQLNELERRVDQISTRLQTRQAGYEQRIAELERELAAAEEENRDLIRAKIREARQNLEWAKAENS